MWFQSVCLSLKHQTSASSKWCDDRREHETAFRWSKDQVYLPWTPLHRLSHAENQWQRNRRRDRYISVVLGGSLMSFTFYLTTEQSTCADIMVFFWCAMWFFIVCRKPGRLQWKEKQIYCSFKLPTDRCSGQRCMRSIKLSARTFLLLYFPLLGYISTFCI